MDLVQVLLEVHLSHGCRLAVGPAAPPLLSHMLFVEPARHQGESSYEIQGYPHPYSHCTAFSRGTQHAYLLHQFLKGHVFLLWTDSLTAKEQCDPAETTGFGIWTLEEGWRVG